MSGEECPSDTDVEVIGPPSVDKMKISSKDGSKVMTVIASPGQGPDRSTEVSYTDTKVCI